MLNSIRDKHLQTHFKTEVWKPPMRLQGHIRLCLNYFIITLKFGIGGALNSVVQAIHL